MISISMIFTALTTAALVITAALATGSVECNFSKGTGAQMCFGAVGQLLIFQLSKTSNTEMTLIKDDKYIILKIQKNQKVTLHEEYVNQSALFNDGTIKLGKAMKRHTGNYVLEEFGSEGVLLKKVNVHLIIQAPVSKPAVSQTCLSPEQMNISCSSEGDGTEFILTLDDLLLYNSKVNMESLADSTAKQNKSSNSNVTISLHGQLTGNLKCLVLNNISRDETVIHLKSCKDLVSSFPVVTVAVAAGVVALLLLVALCLGVLKPRNQPRPTTTNEGK
ncbi:uncharacterized protein LOC125897840 [Epinephelus fuscoguttatus]|uniref:uncharacterized protein LOC125897840 n=1 Tax=Epinephelus fuscoguttatus TaxID=293821 RepID=UPI0020D0D897|nr:uncharacterized protein LOC125897840 [Epinephelus fuscoguttatus]